MAQHTPTWLQQFSAAVRSRFPSKKLQEVLSLYGQIFRVERQWRVTTAADTEAERLYTQDEARKLFRKNKNVSKDFSTFLLVFDPII